VVSPTQRLYFEDARLVVFDAHIVERRVYEGHPAVVLDRSAFYPESGGQPADSGTINDIPVVHVTTEGAVVLHVLESPIEGDTAHGKIDKALRYDHTQQHTGQHVLSAVLLDQAEAQTVSFHMSRDVSTIDVDRIPVSPEAWDAVDAVLRRVVEDDLAISVYEVSIEHADTIGLRRIPDRSGLLRIVDIEGLDRTACGGTHCRRTGELRTIQLLSRTPRRVHGGLYRIPFVCGRRALDDYTRRIAYMEALSTQLDTGLEDIPGLIQKLRENLRQTEKRLSDQEEELLRMEAHRLVTEACQTGSGTVLTAMFPERNADTIKKLARLSVEHSPRIALFVCGTSEMVFVRDEGLSAPHLGELMRTATAMVGGRGGGRPHMASGSVPDTAAAHKALAWAKEQITAEAHGTP